MRRSASEQLRQRPEVQFILGLKTRFAELMLLAVMVPAQTNRPPIGWLNSSAAIGTATDVSAFDRRLEAAGNAAAVAPHPRSMGRAAALVAPPLIMIKPLRQLNARHFQPPLIARRFFQKTLGGACGLPSVL